MGMTGIIFGVIAVAWLVYLVPYFLHRRGQPEDDSDAEALVASSGVTIVRAGVDLASAEDGVTVSTPETRAVKLAELAALDRKAAKRRRRVLIVLFVMQVAAIGVVLFGFGQWWDALIPTGLIVAFLVIARVSVRALRADLARRAERIDASAEEDTVAVKLTADDIASLGQEVELTEPIGTVGSLWEPIPITRPTYVSTPIAPRTVRTIDLTPPATPKHVPVLAEILEQIEADAKRELGRDYKFGEQRRDVG